MTGASHMTTAEALAVDAPPNAEQSLAIYIAVPFCRTHCTYCDFNVYTNLDALKEPYVDAVVEEIVRESKSNRAPALPIHSIYFGGGTPSVLTAEQIGRMLDACARNFAVSPDIEITVEVNPGTVDETKLRALKQMGVNRLSIGVETFDDLLLRNVARKHTTPESLATYEMARRAGFANINLDFIYGWMYQTLAEWNQTLDRALALDAVARERQRLQALLGDRLAAALAVAEAALADLLQGQHDLLQEPPVSVAQLEEEFTIVGRRGLVAQILDGVVLGSLAVEHVPAHFLDELAVLLFQLLAVVDQAILLHRDLLATRLRR